MLKNTFKPLLLAAFVMTLSVTSFAQVLRGSGSYTGNPGYDRGFQSTLYCGNYPESWIRGSAFLDKQSGVLTMQIDLETDATHAGPKGQVLVYITDQYGRLLTRIASTEVGRGGKAPGTAERTTVQSATYLPPYIASQAERITVVPICTGYVNQIWGISLQAIFDAWGNLQQFGTFFF